MKTFSELREAKATYCGRCGTVHVPPSKGGTCPALSKEESVNTADKKPETYKDPATGKMKTRMVPTDKEVVKEKTLTPAEKKKREEVARAMERENPGMDKSKKMAIATATAKRVAEEAEQIDELSKKTLGNYIRAAGPDREAKLKKAQQHTNTGHQLKQYADDKKSLRHAQQHFQISGELQGKAANRKIGINKAVDRLTKEEAELDEAKIKVGDIVKPSKSSTKTMKVTDIVRVPYMGRKQTFVDGIDDQGNKLRRPLSSVVKEEAKPDAVEVMRKKQQMANISTSDKDKLAKIRAMLNKEKKPEND